jgi:undecaprenyl-diphosphatase
VSRVEPGLSGVRRSLSRPLLVGAIALGFAFGFAQLASEVREGETHAFDQWVVHEMQALRAVQPWVTEVMRDLSGVGSTVSLTLITLATVGYLALAFTRRSAVVVAVSVLSGSLLVSLLKSAFGRLRPDGSLAALLAPGLSFPSGHASMAAIVFLTLGALVASTREALRERGYILGVAALFTLLVGLSRVALGVHWATDVLGGWAFGADWAMAWLQVVRSLGGLGRERTSAY